MKIDTEDKKTAYLLGYIHAKAESLAEDLNLSVEAVKGEIINSLLEKTNRKS